MTNEEKKIIKTMLEIGYDRTNIPKADVDKIIYKGLHALEDNAKLKEAVGKIKDEIQAEVDRCENNDDVFGLGIALGIISKHTEGLI